MSSGEHVTDLDEAAALARSYMDAEVEQPGERRFVITRAELRDAGWVFFYSSATFLKSRHFEHAMGGDKALLVADGRVRMVGWTDLPSLGDAFHGGMA